MSIRLSVAAALLLTACAAYDPPMNTDHTTPKYTEDLRRCRDEAHLKALQIAGQTPFTEIRSLFSSNEPERRNVRSCLQGKGYALKE